MRSRLVVTLAAVLAMLAAAPAAGAATFQEGQMRFTVSGSWVSAGTATASCDDPVTGDSKPVQYPSSERVSFKGTSAGRIRYRGVVGQSIFFERVVARPKIKVTVSRIGTPPAGCDTDGKPDCGSRTLAGVANPEFAGPFRRGGRVKLSFDFAPRATSGPFEDPFRACSLPGAFSAWWASAMSPVGDGFDFQSAALDVPTPKGFYRKRSHTFSGSATRRFKGDKGITVGPSSATLKMKVGVSRRVTRSQPAFGSR